jgi:hypothetical protein
MTTEGLLLPDNEPALFIPEPALVIPAKHQRSLQRTLRIASMVGSKLAVNVVDSEHDIPPEPGVYIIEGEVDTERYENIAVTTFALSPVLLSGKIDSSHAVLPGRLAVSYSDSSGTESVTRLPVAAKGYYKRHFDENFGRAKNEIAMTRLQERAGEIAFRPVALVIAPPPYRGKATDPANYDLLLVTRLEAVTTLDNNPWELGAKEAANLEAAELAFSALGRFNASLGLHGDAKPKNIAQGPDITSMVDFETSRKVDPSDPLAAATIANEDAGSLLDSLLDRGFFSHRPHESRAIIERLGAVYLDRWAGLPNAVQSKVYEQVADLAEMHVGYAARSTQITGDFLNLARA